MLVSFLYSPKTLHLAFQSGFRRTACQRRSSRGRLAGTLWPDQDQDNDDHDDFEEGLIKEFFSCLPTTFKDMGNTSIYGERERGCEEDDLDPHGDILAWPSLHTLVAVASERCLQRDMAVDQNC